MDLEIKPTHRITLYPNRLNDGYSFTCSMVFSTKNTLEMLRLYESQLCGLSYDDTAEYALESFVSDPLGATFIIRTTGLGAGPEANVLIAGCVEELTL